MSYATYPDSEPRYVAGCRMPRSTSIPVMDEAERRASEIGSTMLFKALLRYFAAGGRG